MSVLTSGAIAWSRVPVITGMGIVSPIGVGAKAFWNAALSGRSGVGTLTSLDVRDLPRPCRVGGEVRDFYPAEWMSSTDAARAGRFSHFAVACAKMAADDSGFEPESLPPERIQVSFGTSINGMVDVHQSSFATFMDGQEIVPWVPLEYPAHAATSHIAIEVGAQGQSASFSTACAAGLDAIAWAAAQVGMGAATAIFAGGADATLSPFTLQTMYRVGVLADWDGPPHAACRPFERNRSGLVLAEGGAVVLIEEEQDARRRGARIYARILGYASGGEGQHLRKVDTTGATAGRVMRQAVAAALVETENIDYVSAHGNGMKDYDVSETSALKTALGPQARRVPISSLKSMCGQALAGSAPMQVVASCLAIRDRCVPPTINYDEPDPLCDLDYVPNQSRVVRVRNVLIHAHSMGGSHTVMVLGKPN
jgi:3-oxoacyl-[acyl-carrier-protein] synthase II